jgi:ketosteroid isomerase-like protein
MSTFSVICALALAAAELSVATARAAPASPSAAERYIRDSERQWAESVATGDSSVVARILADDFVGVDPKGRQYTKAQMVADTRTSPQYFASNHLNDVRVRFYGSMAVAQGSESWVRRKGDPLHGRFVWTDTWLMRNGKWQIVAAEDLTVAEP